MVEEPLSIRALEVFATLIDKRTFTAAARTLGLGQSTVSGHVAELERRLGLRLVERERGGVVPTEAGKVLLAPVREALRAERHARIAAEELLGLLRGRLRVGASTVPAACLVPTAFGRFHAAHPGVELVLQAGDSEEVLGQVLSGDVDAGWVGREPDADGLLDVVPTGSDRLVLAVAPGHPFAKAGSVAIGRLGEAAWVVREQGSGTQRAIDRALDDAGAALPLPVACQVGSHEAALAMVRAGLGATFASSLAIAHDVEAGRLVEVAVPGFEIERAFFLVARKGDRAGPLARAFLASVAGGARRR